MAWRLSQLGLVMTCHPRGRPADRAHDAATDRSSSACLRGVGARVLPPARALEPRRRDARRRRASARPRCVTRPTGSRRRSPAWSGRSRATCSSSSRSAPRAARGTAARVPESSSSGARCSTAPGVHACPNRVAAVYLELAVLVRALEGLADAARLDTRPTARRCGRACSTCATRCSGRRSTTSAPSPPEPPSRTANVSAGSTACLTRLRASRRVCDFSSTVTTRRIPRGVPSSGACRCGEAGAVSAPPRLT